MIKPFEKYCYLDICDCDYQKWADFCSESKNNEPLLRRNDAVRLEMLYRDDACFSDKQHQENIDFLKGLQWETSIVWSSPQRSAAKMDNLVDDYKKYYGLEEQKG